MNYDPKEVNVILGGTYLAGFAETMVSAEKDEDDFTPTYGAQGEYSVAESHNTLGTVTVTLQHTSPSISYIRSLVNRRATVPCFVVDSNDSSKMKAGGSEARILKTPGFERGTEIGEVEIEIKVFDYKEE
ncbi:DUF3277 domain-containing protein [Bacillaceae bacterium SIJ1]|uniref:phage structural protein n=1 Tax=Litoribacterium kuwaitense TaxID=1398745 RepID=UPI0013EBE8F4|nr:DUF3277 domain-containing protein [Litoribacterium kuwaitense]NGP45968.1 DUF3277 domain-containing protein [Litoribacterium kuwaitense]